MVDCHIHILDKIDDGASSVEVSVEMAKNAKQNGFDILVATPHYIEYDAKVSYEKINAKVKTLNDILKNNNIDIKVFSGNEIYYTENILTLLKNKLAHSLNDSRYFLMELPIVGKPINYFEVLEECISDGFVPVIAHPERYEWLRKEYKNFIKLKELGVKFQINYGSIIKEYGSVPKKNVIKMLRDNMVDLIATDSHDAKLVYEKFEIINKKIINICGKENFYKYTNKNPNKILNNEEI